MLCDMVHPPRNRVVPPAAETRHNIRSFLNQAINGPQAWTPPTVVPRRAAPVAAARQVLSVKTAAEAGRLATRDLSEFARHDLRFVVTPSRGGEFDMPLPDGALYVPTAGETPSGHEGLPWLSPGTLAGFDGRAGDVLAVVMRAKGLSGVVVPLCTPASPGMVSFFTIAMANLFDGRRGLGVEMEEAARQQMLGLWADSLRSLADGIAFARDLVPAGTKAWPVPTVDMEARHVTRLLSQAKDPRYLASWVNIATGALNRGRKEFSDYFG